MIDEHSVLNMVSKRDRTMFFRNAKSRSYRTIRKRFFHRTLLIGFLVVSSFPLYAQNSDNQEFWFVAPDASNEHDDRPTFFMITTGDKPATVTISMPANTGFTPETQTIPAHSYWKYTFSTTAQMNLIENSYTSSGSRTNKGILITSTAPVSAYYQIDGSKNYQKEIFTLKGKKALGQNFYMPFQTKYGVSTTYNTDAFRQIQIVAAEDGTDVVIHPRTTDAIFANTSGGGSTINSGSSLERRTRRLNKGETLLWRANARTTPNLTGTQITSTKPVAVTLFEDCLQGNVGNIDPIGDQLVPTNNLGKNYIVVKGYSSGTSNVTENVVVLAVEDDTKVYLNGTLQETLAAGAFWTHDSGKGTVSPQAYNISASKPVYCMHQSAAGSEIGGALLPSLYSISGRRITFIKNNDLSISSMFLVFRESAENGFTLDGNALTLNAQSTGFEDWMYAKVDLKPISSADPVCTVANQEGSFALGYFNGSSNTSLYGYFSAFGTFSFGSDTIYHCGASYQFDAPYALSYKWTLPDNTILEGTNRLEAKKSGRYILEVNQDPYVITDETYLKLQNFNHLLSSPVQLLVDKSYNFTIELNPQKAPDNYFNTSYEWDFGEGASIQTSDQPEVKVFYTTPGTKEISLKIENLDALCDTIITREITVLDTSEGLVMYWKTDAEDSNWNNVNNWAKDAAGTPLPVIPSRHTRVYLPGNESTTAYPSLSEENTDWAHYGQPEVNEIVFRYGSELHYQHKLKYEKAYVNYNWGYYDNDSADANGQPKNSWEDARKLQRDTWHILATPLKSMASGDFALAGHPFSWQKQFEAVANLHGSVIEGDFSKAFPSNDIALAGNNNAIAVKMAGYQDQTGYRQEYLEELKGVIEIPYFENEAVIPHYPAHNYDALSKRSYFYYFDTKSLKLINSPLGSMNRAAEAYRFVYETDQNEVPADSIYVMPLYTEGLGSTREVMVGNPLLAPINAEAFADANTDAIVFAEGYKLLSDDGFTWQQHYFTESDPVIPAWKAFIVTLQPSTSTLSFPLETTSFRAATVVLHGLRVSYATGAADNALYLQVLKDGTRSGDQAILQNNRNANDTEIRKMILPEGHEVPEIFFMSSGRDLSYLIRNIAQDEKEIPIGVKTSDVRSRLLLEFGNIPAFSASTGASLVLVDKRLNIRQDLTRNPVYPFIQQESGLDRQYVDRNRFVLQLSGETGINAQDEPENGINIVYQSGILKVTSDENIDAVSVYDLYGRLAFSARSINLTQYTHPVPLQGKLFLVRIKTASGKEKVKKIMGN